MNPMHARQGYKPDSNKILQTEQLLIESKKEKVVEIFKASGEVFEILESAKKDPMVLQATQGGQGLDPTSMSEFLFKDKHFINMLGDLLNRRPGAKKVEIFMAKELR